MTNDPKWNWRERIMRSFFGDEPPRQPQKFSTDALKLAPGVLWLVRHRIEEHRKEYGGRAPHHLILHTGTMRSLFTEYAHEKGFDPRDLPALDTVIFGSFEGVRLYHCRCNKPLARDTLATCDGKEEDL